MHALALTVALMSSSGGLLSEHLPRGVRLLESPTTAAGTVLGAAPQLDLEAMSRTELEMERLRLVDDRRSVAPGIIFLVSGGVTFLLGSTLLLADVLVAGAIITLIGAGAVVAGIILLVSAVSHNARNTASLRRIEQRIGTLEQTGPGGGDAPPPPPPPPPAGVWRELPAVPQLVVATF